MALRATRSGLGLGLEARAMGQALRRRASRAAVVAVLAVASVAVLAIRPVSVSAEAGSEPSAHGSRELGASVPADRTELADLSPQEIDARTSYLTERLDARRKHATWWYRSWFAVYAGGLAFGTLRASIADTDGVRTDSIVSGVKSAIGLADLLLRPLEARHGADAVRALPAETEEQRVRRLEVAETQLAANADRARHARDWRVHLSSFGLNLAGSTALLIVGAPIHAAESFAIGTIASELAIYTEPVTPARDWDDYRARTEARNWTLVPTPVGLAFYATF